MGFLLLFPIAVAAVLALVRNNAARRVVVYGGGIVIAVASVAFVAMHIGTRGEFFEFESEIVNICCTVIDFLIGIIVAFLAWRYQKWIAFTLALVQMALTGIFVAGGWEHMYPVAHSLYFDSFSLLMVAIIGVVGSGIGVYAIGYMDDHHDAHPAIKDRRARFFALFFVFLSAMYLIVLSDNMVWMFTGWEITTVCSFLLIGYDQNQISVTNAFRQIVMNMVGGIAFCCALIFCGIHLQTFSFSEFIALGAFEPALVVVPVVCLSLAGITKAAQMPFHTWLLGAMVAPTPTSALLHSSTMVKAGVFVLLKMAPIYAVSFIPSMMVILVGGITFCLCSFLAISQSNAKRVLAYSTIANLGLIVACAGVGSPEAVWAGMFLILFHAVAKSLLFMCVGTAEHHIGSRDIESMDGLFQRMPRLARYMMLGIMIMFIAPFGMLVAKWGTLVSFLDGPALQSTVLVLLLAFGSGATFLFWAKWLGKLAGIAGSPDDVETTVHSSEWIGTGLMVVLCILCCVAMPLISDFVVRPYIEGVWGQFFTVLASDNLAIASVCTVFVVAVLFGAIGRSSNKKRVGVYLSGLSIDNSERKFKNSMSGVSMASSRNWYMESLFGEQQIDPVGTVVCIGVIVGAFIVAILAFQGITIPGIPGLM
jgi:ech hydrogenase subunit A